MADIFISYSKSDTDLTRDLANDLGAQGFSTWWDASLAPGDMFSEAIMRELDLAKIVIVIWTKTSVVSKWVAAEASRALDAGKLIPICSHDLTINDIPLPFNTLQTAPLTDRVALFAAIEKRAAQCGIADTLQPPKKNFATTITHQSDPALLVVAGSEWARLCQTDDTFQLQRFAKHFASTYFSELAQERIAELEAERELLELERRSRLIILCPICHHRTIAIGVVNERGVRGACQNCRRLIEFIPVPGSDLTQPGTPTEDGFLVPATLVESQQTLMPTQNARHYAPIYKTSERPISALTLSQDGSLMAVGSREGDVSVFDIILGKKIWQTSAHDLPISAVSISNNNKFVVSGDTNGRLMLWHVSTGKQYQEFEGHFDTAIKTACFDGNDRMVASAGTRTVRFWRFPGDEAIKTMGRFGSPASAIGFAPEQNLFIVSFADGSVKLYETGTWQQVDSIDTGLSSSFSTCIGFSQNGRTLLIAAGDCDGNTANDVTVANFDIASKKRLFFGPVRNVGQFCLAAHSCSLLCTQKGKIRLLSLPTCNEEWSVDAEGEFSLPTRDEEWEADGVSVWTTHDAGTIAAVACNQDVGTDEIVIWHEEKRALPAALDSHE